MSTLCSGEGCCAPLRTPRIPYRCRSSGRRGGVFLASEARPETGPREDKLLVGVGPVSPSVHDDRQEKPLHSLPVGGLFLVVTSRAPTFWRKRKLLSRTPSERSLLAPVAVSRARSKAGVPQIVGRPSAGLPLLSRTTRTVTAPRYTVRICPVRATRCRGLRPGLTPRRNPPRRPSPASARRTGPSADRRLPRPGPHGPARPPPASHP